MPVDCRCSHRPGLAPGCASRSELNAIHAPSGDQAGRKFPECCFVRFVYVFDAMSISQMSAVPAARVETKASVRPLGDSAP